MTINSFRDIYQSLDIQIDKDKIASQQNTIMYKLDRVINYAIPYDTLLKYCMEPYAQQELICKYLQIIPDVDYTNMYNCNALTYYCARNNNPTMDMIILFLNSGVNIKKCNTLHEINSCGIISIYSGTYRHDITGISFPILLKDTNAINFDGKINKFDDPVIIFFKRKQRELSRDDILIFLDKLKVYNYDIQSIIDRMNKMNSSVSNCVIT